MSGLRIQMHAMYETDAHMLVQESLPMVLQIVKQVWQIFLTKREYAVKLLRLFKSQIEVNRSKCEVM